MYHGISSVGQCPFWEYLIHYFDSKWMNKRLCCCCCSVTKSCLTLCNPMDCTTPGSLVLHYLPEVCSDSCPLSWWCYPTISSSAAPFSFCLKSFPASGPLVTWPDKLFFLSQPELGFCHPTKSIVTKHLIFLQMYSLYAFRVGEGAGVIIHTHHIPGNDPQLWSFS